MTSTAQPSRTSPHAGVKLLREKYKTFEGATKRCAFERSLAPFEHRQGYKAHVYSYRVVQVDGQYRVERFRPEAKAAA